MRIIKAFWTSNVRCDEINGEKIRLRNGTYKLSHQVKSKEFCELIQGPLKLVSPKININLDVNDDNHKYVIKNYFGTLRRLTNTRHKILF